MIHFRTLEKDTDFQVESIKENISLLATTNQYHYFIYFVPKEFDKVSNIQFELEGEEQIIEPVQLLIDDMVSCDVDKNLELINCATHSQFAFKIYFKAELQSEFLLTIKYNSYDFSREFKGFLTAMPFQTDTHVYVDNKVEDLLSLN